MFERFCEWEDPIYGNDFSDMTGNASETKNPARFRIYSNPAEDVKKISTAFSTCFQAYDKRKKAAVGTKDRKECRFGNGNGKWRTDTR